MIKNRDFLEAFEKVAQLGTTHAAAAALGVTQTAITQRLKALERELELTLFVRSRRGMSLTEEGRTLLRYRAAAQELDARFLAKLKGGRRQEISLTIVGPTSAISTRVATDCASLYEKHPFLRLHLRTKDEDSRVDLVKRGAADLAIVPPDRVPNEMDSKRIKPERYLLVASSKWKHRKLSDILAQERIIDFSETDRTTSNYLRQFRLEGMAARERLYVNENAALIHYFSLGVGFGTLTETVAKPHLDSGALIALNRGMALPEPLALVWYPRASREDYFQDIIRSIR